LTNSIISDKIFLNPDINIQMTSILHYSSFTIELESGRLYIINQRGLEFYYYCIPLKKLMQPLHFRNLITSSLLLEVKNEYLNENFKIKIYGSHENKMPNVFTSLFKHEVRCSLLTCIRIKCNSLIGSLWNLFSTSSNYI